MSHSMPKLIIGTSLLVGLPASAHAASFCVAGAAQFAAALEAAESNGADDIVRLTTATIFVPTGSHFTYQPPTGQSQALQILGGFNPGCATRTAGSTTLIDASTTVDSYAFSTYFEQSYFRMESIVVSGFGSGGAEVNTYRTAVAIEASDSVVEIEANAFRSNAGVQAAALDVTVSDGDLRLRDNIIAGNTVHGSSGGSSVQVGGVSGQPSSCLVENNTVVGNSHSATRPAGMIVRECSEARIANNIFWSNSVLDLQLFSEQGTAYALSYNDIGNLQSDDLPVAVIGGQSTNPLFEAGSFVLSLASPLINAGMPGDGEDNPTDHLGGVRVQDSRIDIGAIETSTQVFANSFE